jgi:curved DNA-binding protein CbpA
VAKRNFYATLAVPMRAGPVEIWLAYQRMMFTIDPHTGMRPDAERFREVQNAYRTLSNPVRRRAHDIELSMGRLPLSAETPRWRPPVIISDDFLTMKPSLEELRDHVAQNFVGYRRKSTGPHTALGFEAILRREDARFGCHLPVSLTEGPPQVLFEIPQDTHDGEQFEMDLNAIGIHNLTLRVRIVVL